MLQSLRKYMKNQGAVIVLLLFTIHLLPQELLHSLFPHNDTEDCAVVNYKVSVSSEHKHCNFEQLEGTGIAEEELLFTPVISSHSFAHPFYKTAEAVAEQPLNLFLRGPPQISG